jgi:hypothetical protein
MAIELDVGARLIGVDLQEHVAEAQRRALGMGDDDLDLLHAGHYRRMTTDAAPDLSRATARLVAASHCPAASCTPPTADESSTAPVRRASTRGSFGAEART